MITFLSYIKNFLAISSRSYKLKTIQGQTHQLTIFLIDITSVDIVHFSVFEGPHPTLAQNWFDLVIWTFLKFLKFVYLKLHIFLMTEHITSMKFPDYKISLDVCLYLFPSFMASGKFFNLLNTLNWLHLNRATFNEVNDIRIMANIVDNFLRAKFNEEHELAKQFNSFFRPSETELIELMFI